MEKRTPWCHGLTPFINNSDPRSKNPMEEKITENGIHSTIDKDLVLAEVPTGMTPEEEQEVLEENY